MILWIIIGTAIVTATFFLTGTIADPWQAVNNAGLAAAVYLLILIAYSMRKPFPLWIRAGTYVAFVVLGTAIFSAWTTMDEQSHWQRNQLLKIQSVITRGVVANELHATYLLPVFETYHRQESVKRTPIGELFRAAHPEAKQGMNIRKEIEHDSVMVYLTEFSNDTVVLIGQSMYSRGADPDFKNYNGRVGMIQARAILTEKGVTYEQEN
jgi:hypothetical protein